MSPRSFGDLKVTIYLLDEGHAIAPVVPPLKDEDEARDERGGASERHIKLDRGDCINSFKDTKSQFWGCIYLGG